MRLSPEDWDVIERANVELGRTYPEQAEWMATVDHFMGQVFENERSSRRRADLITNYDPPPIPDRRHDWTVWVDGEEEDKKVGWGETLEDAINDWEEFYGPGADGEDY